MLEWHDRRSEWWEQLQNLTPRKTGHSTWIWRDTSNVCSIRWDFSSQEVVYWGSWWRNWRHWGGGIVIRSMLVPATAPWNHMIIYLEAAQCDSNFFAEKSCHVLWCFISSIWTISSKILCNIFRFSLVQQFCCCLMSFHPIVVVAEVDQIPIEIFAFCIATYSRYVSLYFSYHSGLL